VAGAVRQRTEVLSTSIFLEISIGQLERGIALSLLMVGIASAILLLLRLGSGKTLFGGNVQP
jgi:molybdate transport system permease protein